MHNTHTHPTLEKNYGINKFKAAIAISVALVSVMGSSAVLAKKCTNKNTTYTCTPLRRTLCNFDYYVGVDAMRRNMHYEKNLGSNFMKKNVPEINLFWGVKFNEHFGMEIGYGVSETTNSSGIAKHDSKMMGYSTGDSDTITYHSIENKFTSWKLNVIGYSKQYKESLSFFLKAGLVSHSLKYQHKYRDFDTSYGMFMGPEKPQNLSGKKHYVAPTASLGIIYKPQHSKIGVRTYYSWSQEHRNFKGNVKERYNISAKNIYSYGVGIFVEIN